MGLKAFLKTFLANPLSRMMAGRGSLFGACGVYVALISVL